MSFRHHYAHPAVALLMACNARLAVMDEPLEGGASGPPGGADMSSCGDSIKNGNEIGVDCGGNCAPCAPCDCAVSEVLMPLSCAEPLGPGMTWNAGYPHTDDTGDTISFDACAEEASAHPSCRQFIDRSSTGLSELTPPSGSGTIEGLSADGEHALFLPLLKLGTEALVYGPDGSWTGTELAPNVAIMAANGSVAGFSAPKPSGRVDLMRWSAAAGTTVLTELPFDGATVIYLSGISSDGFVVSGYATVDEVSHGFIHDPVNGLVIDLGDDLPETATAAQVLALSGTGDAATGHLHGAGPDRVFYWSVAGGLVDVGQLADGFPGVSVQAHLSTDGSVVATTLESPRSASGTRWTNAGTAPLIPEGQSTAYGIDADGSTIIGMSFDEAPQFGLFVWTPDAGARSIYAALQAAGVDVTGWQLDEPTDISADGKVVTGFGQCGGSRTSFRLVLPD